MISLEISRCKGALSTLVVSCWVLPSLFIICLSILHIAPIRSCHHPSKADQPTARSSTTCIEISRDPFFFSHRQLLPFIPGVLAVSPTLGPTFSCSERLHITSLILTSRNTQQFSFLIPPLLSFSATFFFVLCTSAACLLCLRYSCVDALYRLEKKGYQQLPLPLSLSLFLLRPTIPLFTPNIFSTPNNIVPSISLTLTVYIHHLSQCPQLKS